MKKAVSFIVALAILCAMCAFSASAVKPADIGKLKDGMSVIEGVNADNILAVKKLIVNEYNRACSTRGVKDKGNKYFHFGETDVEYVHGWAGTRTEFAGDMGYFCAMAQCFTGGNSDSMATLGYNDGFCCIVVTPESLIKGEAYTVRDGIANAWGNAGATNSTWGMPTDNQRWIEKDGEMYCYQTFDNGYAMALNASCAFTEWYDYSDGATAPTGGTLDYNWGVAAIDDTRSDIVDFFTVSGDVNGDGLITVSDVVDMRAKIMDGSDDDLMETADFNGDGLMSVSDIVTLRHVIITGFRPDTTIPKNLFTISVVQ